MSLRSRIPIQGQAKRLPRRLSLRASSEISALLEGFFIGLPEFSGDPIRVSVLPRLMASRGQLLSGSPGCGKPVHAASFIWRREIVLESRLLRQPRLFRLILLHEIFHFVWARLGNEKRRQFDALLQRELASHAKGELGHSAQLKKDRRPVPGTPGWRGYICESFCDTAAFVLAGFNRHSAFTLAQPWRRQRRAWFVDMFENGWVC